MKCRAIKVILTFCIFFSSIYCCFAESNFEKADSYYDENNYALAKQYYEASLFSEKNYTGKLFYRLGFSYEQLKIQKSIYPRLYSAAAYCFERDNDKDNIYYEYSLSKEKDLGINHNDYSEETIEKITKELYRKTQKKNSTTSSKELNWYLVLFLFFILTIIAFIDVIIRFFSKNRYKLNDIDYNLSDLFKSSNFINQDNEFINNLKSCYKNIVENAYYGNLRIRNPETFLLYKFGQVIFTKNGNKVDYKTVTAGLKQVFFTETNTVDAMNLKISFINTFNKYFQIWYELQKLYNDRLYEIPELGILLSVLYSKMDSGNFIKNANNVVTVCNHFEKYKTRRYRNDFIVIANKMYHEKSDDLSKKLTFELNQITGNFFYKIKLAKEKVFWFILYYFPHILFIYILLFMFNNSSFSFFNLILTGLLCFIVKKIKSKLVNPIIEYSEFGRLMTKAEREALDREIKEQEERDKARRAREQEQKTYSSSSSNDYYETSNSDNYENSESVDNSQEFSRNQRSQTQEDSQFKEKPKTTAIKYYCKYCGTYKSDLFQLTHGICKNNSSGRHVLYEGSTAAGKKYYCEYCGTYKSDLFQLTHGICKESPTGKHIPYEGEDKTKYYCKYCGTYKSDLFQLTHGICRNSPTGKHFPTR